MWKIIGKIAAVLTVLQITAAVNIFPAPTNTYAAVTYDVTVNSSSVSGKNGVYSYELDENETAEFNISSPVSGICEISIGSCRGDAVIYTAESEYEVNTSNGAVVYARVDKGENVITIKGGEGGAKLSRMTLALSQSLYEAEGGRLGGYAVRSESDTASGGKIVSRIGAPNTDFGNVMFDIYAPEDGVYGAVIDFIPTGTSAFYVQCGEQTTEIIPGEYSEGEPQYSTSGRRYIELELKQGSNDVKVYSNVNYALDLDCITVFAPKEELENVYEETEAALSGGAYIRGIDRAYNGSGVSGIGLGGEAEFKVNVGASAYDMVIYYCSPEFRGLQIEIDGRDYDYIYCPITAEEYNIDTAAVYVKLSAGTHKITFKNEYANAPDIDKIQFIPVSERKSAAYSKNGTVSFANADTEVIYDMASGKADFYSGGVLRVSGIESAVKLEGEEYNRSVKSSDYSYRRLETEDLNDGYGEGTKYTVVSYGVGLPVMKQNYYVYDGLEYILTSVEVESSDTMSSNFLAPIAAMGDGAVNIGDIDDGRALFVPYDNDNWVRYRGDEIDGQHISFWVTSLYDNTSRNAVVTGSVDHDTFKTGTSAYSHGESVNFLGAFGGIWSSQYTYDYVPHGSIDGSKLSSPRFFLGYYDDWRDGMEEYGTANANNIARLEWNNGTPFGYNSWVGQGSALNYKDSITASDMIKSLETNGFYDETGVAYINLDSYWDSMSDEQLAEFVEHCHSNGQKAGIYWSHFVFWATDTSWHMGVPGHDEDTYDDASLKEPNGGAAAIQKDSTSIPLDPTSDAMKARLDYFMTKFVDLGFEYLKIDFLNYAALEGVHADPNVKTGMQAYNQALELFTQYVDTDKFFLSYSIAPIFPYQYAHARRIACDTAADIGEVQYMLNSLNFGWWMDNTLYEFTDPDQISLKASATEAVTRYNSAAICGTLMMMSDDYDTAGMRELTKYVTSNEEVNEIARMGRAFRPVEGNMGQWCDNVFTLDTDDAFYIAVFNFERTKDTTLTVDMERVGLSGSKEYTVKGLWSGESFAVTGSFDVTLTPEQSEIYKVEK